MCTEVMAWLDCRPGGTYVDGTVGLGGHAQKILEHSAPDGLLIALDKDIEAIKQAKERLTEFKGRVRFFNESFRHLDQVLEKENIPQVDGILLDLGLSSMQLGEADRGFSFSKEGPLDMRMDQRESRTAEDLLANLSQTELFLLFRDYGEERWAGRISRAIVNTRQEFPLTTTSQLSLLIIKSIPKKYRHPRIHPATRVFQSLRIAVNDEMGALEDTLSMAVDQLRPGGRLCIISFHSLEDRRVKHTFRRYEKEGILKVLTKRPLTASPEEVFLNPRSRSAKFRVAERLAGNEGSDPEGLDSGVTGGVLQGGMA